MFAPAIRDAMHSGAERDHWLRRYQRPSWQKEMGNQSVLGKINHIIQIERKHIITYFERDKHNIEFIVNVLILFGKFQIHK